MQISHLCEDTNGAGGESCENETPNTLVQRDLVTLYQNVDTKQTSANHKKSLRPPNQYVETVVYNDDQESEGSDSEIYSNEDFYDVVLINKERIDLINNFPSVDKTLCQKFGDIAIRADRGTGCTDSILFKNRSIKERFNSLNGLLNFGTFDGAFFSTSLLDFVCCNNLEDNSNLYMDNIIQYARRTIEQLKRISNGDYLTEKAKEKWKTLGNEYKDRKENEIVKVASSNPLRIECNVKEFNNRWRDFIHSELDIRSLTKILEKRIIKIPRFIYGSFTFLDKRCENNLVISCQKESDQTASGDGSESQIGIVVQLKNSKTDNLARAIESVLVIRNSLPSIKDESWLPLEFHSLNSETNIKDNVQNQITLTEFNEPSEDREVHTFTKEDENSTEFAFQCVSSSDTKSSELSLSEFSSLFTMATNDGTSNFSSDKQYNHGEQVTIETQISCFRAQDDLFTSLQKLGTQTVVLEENEEASLTKKKSPTKVRIKSPYENKSHALEEKKRRKLLEIRERREKKKKSLSENCKVSKHKHGKGAVMAQSSNSVTKLSITNKSFYTSIYGDKMKVTNNHSVKHSHIEPLDKDDDLDEDSIKDVTILKKENRVNYNYYLDETETEMMNLKLKQRQKYQTTKPFKRPPSMLSNSTTNFDSFAGASCNSSTSDLKPKSDSFDSGKRARSCFSEMIHNTPHETTNASFSKKSLTSVECKRSIDKIYELMRKLSKVDSSESVYSKHKVTPPNTSCNNSAMNKKATAVITDSCASIKCQLTSSNPSIFSFEGKNEEILFPDGKGKKSGLEANSITKVIISSKPHVRTEKNETKPHKKVRIHSPENITKNPLKAISHLINEFDNIQKRHRGVPEPRDCRKTNSFVESKTFPRFNLLKKVARGDSENKDGKLIPNKNVSNNDTKNQYRYPMVRGKVMNEPVGGNVNKVVEKEKKVLDIVDEAIREARGEAVKGPSRQFTRLDSLAQPKKSYANAQLEVVKPRYGRNYSSGTPPQVPDKTRPIRQRRNEQEIINVTSSKTANNIPPKVADKYKRVRRPSNVPIENVAPQISASNYRQRTVPEAPRTSKKMIPVESNLKKRPFTLSSSVTSSNLLQKSPVSNEFPAFHVLQNTRTPICNAATTPSFEKDAVENKVRLDPAQNDALVSLSVINESKTSLSCNEKRNDFFTTLSSNDELISICSDYIIDVFEDKNILTAVSNILPKNAKVKDVDKENDNGIQTIYSDTNIPHNGIVRRIDSLEKALYDQISQGTFPKRLKIKKLTLTPKQSTNQVLLLQCGDANSIIKKSCMSQNLHFGRNKSITSLINMPLLSDSFQDQCFPRLPVNFTTVGYVFSNSKSIEMKSIENSSTTSSRCMGIQTHFRSNNNNLLPNKYSNDEKSVQTVRFNDEIINNNFNKTLKTEKVDKSTHLSKSLLNLNKTRENENGITKKENIDNTTSLDILVELLDEIEKITKYQNLKASEKQNKELNEPYKLLSKPREHTPIKQYCDTISVDVKRKIPRQCINSKINCVDKEVAVNITKESVNEFTETPHSVVTNCNKTETNSLTVNVTNLNKERIDLVTNANSQISTNKSVYENAPNSQTGIVSQPSSQSIISLYDYRAYCLKKFKISPIHNYDECNKFLEYKALEKNESKDIEKYKIIHLKNTPQHQKGISISNQKDFDDTLKMKRDILVTVYSILVFTVFAALSFPEFMYRS